jgi:adenosylhomocysteinase
MTATHVGGARAEDAPVETDPSARPDDRPRAARVRLAWRQMPILAGLRRQVRSDRPLRGWPVAVAMHVSVETAHLVVTLKDAGARLQLYPSNPDTLDPAAVEELRRRAIRVAPATDASSAAARLAEFRPRLLVDNASLLTACAGDPALAAGLVGATIHSRNAERTTRALLAGGAALAVPIIPVADSVLKSAIETPAGTGQSTVHALVRATGVQLSGKRAVVIGYGTAGTGIARYLRGMRCRVTVVDTSAVACLRALADGHDVGVLDNALADADLAIAATGTRGVVTARQVDLLPDGILLGNIGHHPDAVDVPGLAAAADRVTDLGDGVAEYRVNGRSIFLLGGGSQLNHVCAGGNSSETMDLTLSLHVLCLLRLAGQPESFAPGLNSLPESFSETVARAKLRALGLMA